MLQKIENYKNACSQLSTAVSAYSAAPEDALYRDGLIQRFEFTFELAWKSLKEYMEDQGADMNGITFSKQVFKAAYANRLIHDEAVWLSMLDARNLMSHIYDEETAVNVAQRICTEFIVPLAALAAFYKEL